MDRARNAVSLKSPFKVFLRFLGPEFLSDLLFGSVSDKLKHRTQVPLLLIKSDAS